MRILHFSDFHLCPGEAGKRSLDILDRMIDAVNELKKEKPIDLVVFSGDMVDKAGYGFTITYKEALDQFKAQVIDKVVAAAEIAPYKFLLVGGNHEIERGKADEDEHGKQINIDSENQLECYMTAADMSAKMADMQTFIDFQKEYYDSVRCQEFDIESNMFETTLKFDVNGAKTGVVLLNSAWMCYDNNDEKHIAMGVSQLNKSWPKFKDCNLKIALAHHHPRFLQDYDMIEIYKVLHKRFDIYFCGHTHNHQSKYEEAADGSIFESVAAGNLYNNMHTADPNYKNGFTVIDYSVEDAAVEVTPYVQQSDESFDVDLNYGNNNDGTWYFYRHETGVFKKLDQWRKDNTPEFSILADEVLAPKRAELADPTKARIVLSALSGIGKTRLVYDAFNDGTTHENSYYCEITSTNKESLIKELHRLVHEIGKNAGMIIIDNASMEFYNSIVKDVPSNIKLICVENEYYDVKAAEGTYLLRLDVEDLRKEITEFLTEQLGEDHTGLVMIAPIVDCYPFLAHKLLEEYRKSKTVKLETADDLVMKLLGYVSSDDKRQLQVMILLSLFQPFPLRKANKRAFEFLMKNEILSGLSGSYIENQKVLNEVVSRFNGTLIDKTDKWINVRPLPLAVWMVGKWFETLDDGLVEDLLDQMEELKVEDEGAYRLLTESMSKRIVYMRQNPVAYDLITALNEDASSPFAKEKVVCSDLGSRLFLSMAAVNPVAVAKCLNNVIGNKSTEWITENIADSVRRNMVRTLEKLCFSKGSYSLGAILLAKLALAENESWSNNSSGQFVQLFHIILAGTEADLNARLATLNEMCELGDSFNSLFIKAIDAAFVSSGFVRMGGAEKFGDDVLNDYQPMLKEVWVYWYGCKDLLLKALDCNFVSIEDAAKIVENHANHWIRDGYFDTLFVPLVNRINEQKNGYWPELYALVKRFVRPKDLFRYPDEKKQEIKDYINSLRPTSFITRLQDAQVEYWNRERRAPERTFEILESLYFPLAQAFVDEKIYQKEDEIEKLVYDKDFIDIVFTRKVVSLLSDEQLSELFDSLLAIVRRDNDELHSPYLIKVCLESKGRQPLYKFLDEIYALGYSKLFLSISSRVEDSNLSQLYKIESLNKSKPFEVDYLDLYLSYVSCETTTNLMNMLETVCQLHNDRLQDVMACLLRFRYVIRKDDPEVFYAFVKKMLLAYPIDNRHPRTNFEYTRLVIDMLKEKNDNQFASDINCKLIEGLNTEYLHNNFEGIYSVLLTKYRDVVWDDFIKAFLSDEYGRFWMQISHEIGSGFHFGAGPMFADNDEKIKRMCLDHPDQAPAKIASMVPVFSAGVDKEESFSPLFLWLLEKYGEQYGVRYDLHANMHSFSWTGSPIGLFEKFKECLRKIPKSEKAVVNQWVSDCIAEYDAEIEREKSNNDYMRMHYGHEIG